MQIRKLDRAEHELTRALYEEVFSEDDAKFVDYYYRWKIKDNEIYVAEDEDGIHAMVHLNPFTVVYRGREHRLHYIVAVATQKEYRHRGLMSRLLAMAEQDMKEAGEEFTFLMPASEKIYLPFGYRFFGWQRQGMLNVAENDAGTAECREKRESAFCRPVHPQEYEILADFANEVLDRQFSLYVKRDASYYERLCAEQQCQGGDVMVITMCERMPESAPAELVEEKLPGHCSAEAFASGHSDMTAAQGSSSERIIGAFCTSPDDQEEQSEQNVAGQEPGNEKPAPGTYEEHKPVLREVLLDPDCFQTAQNALMHYIRPYGCCKVEGCQPELPLMQENSVPLMMGKVPGNGVLTELPERDTVFLNEVV